MMATFKLKFYRKVNEKNSEQPCFVRFFRRSHKVLLLLWKLLKD